MIPQILLQKQFSLNPFLPAIITLIAQILFLNLSKILLNRARDELKGAGVPGILPREKAIQTAEGFGLISQIYGGVLPLIGTIPIVLIGVKQLDPTLVSLIYTFMTMISLLLIFLLSGRISDIYDRFNTDHLPSLPWKERFLLKLRFDSYGAPIEWSLILFIFTVQCVIAFLQLPDKYIDPTFKG